MFAIPKNVYITDDPSARKVYIVDEPSAEPSAENVYVTDNPEAEKVYITNNPFNDYIYVTNSEALPPQFRKEVREASPLFELPKIEVPPSLIADDLLLQESQESESEATAATAEPEMESAYEEGSPTLEAKPQFTPSSASDVFFTSAIFGTYFCATLAIGELALLLLWVVYVGFMDQGIIGIIVMIVLIGAAIIFTGGIALYLSGIAGFILGGIVGGIAGLVSGAVNSLIYTLSDTNNQYNEAGLFPRIIMGVFGGGIFYIAGTMLSEWTWQAYGFPSWLVWVNNIGFAAVGFLSGLFSGLRTEVRDKSESEDVSLFAPLKMYFKLGEAFGSAGEGAIDLGATLADNRTVIKQGGKTYRKNMLGQWEAEKDFLRRDKVERDWKGDPVIERDWKGDEKIERDWKDDPIIPSDQ